MPLYMFSWPHGEKIIFLGFLGFGTQKRVNKIRYQQYLHPLRFYISYILLGYTLGTLAMSIYFSALCDNIVHDICTSIYMLVCGWSCTLYDGPSWLREWPSLAMSAHDLVVWVCAQGNCCRCIFMLYCVHNHRGVTVPIHVTKWYLFPRVCDMHQYVWCVEGLWLFLAWALWHVPYT